MKDIKPKFSLTACGSRGCLAAAAMPRLIIEADQDFTTQGYNDATDMNGDGIATIADAKPSAAPSRTTDNCPPPTSRRGSPHRSPFLCGEMAGRANE